MILADTSVWIDHFRRNNPELVELLDQGEVLMHHFVLGELACGNIRNRREVLDLLAALPPTVKITDDEALTFIEKRALFGRGLGLVDIHLLASTLLHGTARLWTLDRTLRSAAQRLKISFSA